MQRVSVILAILLATAVLAGPAWGQGFPVHQTSPAQPKWESSSTCKECHPQIHEEWQASMHRRAGLKGDPVFAGLWPIFADAMKRGQGQEVFFCALCHTPAADRLQQFVSGQAVPSPDDPEQAEGVSCHFCHSITGLQDTPVAPIYTLSVGDTYFGIHPDAEPDGHKVQVSALHRTSQVCAGCHGYLKLNDVSVCNLQTEEWSGKENCLGCHMPVVLGPPSLTSDQPTHYSHLFPGAHFAEMIGWAATLKMTATPQDQRYMLTINIFNQNAHKLPSTQPFRMVFLKVTAFDAQGQVVWGNFKDNPQEDQGAVFVKLFGKGDKVGVPTWEATRVALDTRIGPRSEVERFYEIPRDLKPVRITAQLFYYLVPPQAFKNFNLAPDGFTENPHLIAAQELELK